MCLPVCNVMCIFTCMVCVSRDFPHVLCVICVCLTLCYVYVVCVLLDTVCSQSMSQCMLYVSTFVLCMCLGMCSMFNTCLVLCCVFNACLCVCCICVLSFVLCGECVSKWMLCMCNLVSAVFTVNAKIFACLVVFSCEGYV